MPDRVGLIGDPVAHSRSPAMHNAAFVQLGIAASYELWHTPAAELPQRIAMLRQADVLGANVTLPHKSAVLPLLDDVETTAANIGAVNTIYKRDNGTLIGANTDAPALVEALREEGSFDPSGKRVLLLGASGAARAAAFALIEAGVSTLVVANRTLERAEQLLGDILASLSDEIDTEQHVNGTLPPLVLATTALPVDQATDERSEPQLVALALDDADLPDYLAASDLVINATSLGWHADETPLPTPTFASGTLVYDMVYRQTRLLQDAAAQGAHTLDGRGMLLRQGALAFTRWTGHPAPLAVMRETLT
jgi:shikimate dehydrogenase